MSAFRWDLVYLYAGIHAADNSPAVKALAPTVLGLITKLKAERSDFEDIENAYMIALALRTRRDHRVDATHLAMARSRKSGALGPSYNYTQVIDDCMYD